MATCHSDMWCSARALAADLADYSGESQILIALLNNKNQTVRHVPFKITMLTFTSVRLGHLTWLTSQFLITITLYLTVLCIHLFLCLYNVDSVQASNKLTNRVQNLVTQLL